MEAKANINQQTKQGLPQKPIVFSECHSQAKVTQYGFVYQNVFMIFIYRR